MRRKSGCFGSVSFIVQFHNVVLLRGASFRGVGLPAAPESGG